LPVSVQVIAWKVSFADGVVNWWSVYHGVVAGLSSACTSPS